MEWIPKSVRFQYKFNTRIKIFNVDLFNKLSKRLNVKNQSNFIKNY